MSTQKLRLNETAHLSTQNICYNNICSRKENIFNFTLKNVISSLNIIALNILPPRMVSPICQ